MQRLGQWGIPFLDKHLSGICTGDLIVFGAMSGTGKTSFSNAISRYAADQGIPTVLFSLENASGDWLKQNIYTLFKRGNPASPMSYRDFIIDYCNDKMKYKFYEDTVREPLMRLNAQKCGADLVLIESNDGIDNFDILIQNIIAYIKSGYKFFLIDHIDHLSNDQARDLQYIRVAMKTLADLAFNEDVCIMTYSQIRKDLPSDCMIPGMYDLKGGSQKTDIASIVITLARFPFFDDKVEGIYSSIMAIRKDRYGHLAMGRLGWRNGSYLPDYKEIYEFDDRGYVVDGVNKAGWKKASKELEEEFHDEAE